MRLPIPSALTISNQSKAQFLGSKPPIIRQISPCGPPPGVRRGWLTVRRRGYRKCPNRLILASTRDLVTSLWGFKHRGLISPPLHTQVRKKFTSLQFPSESNAPVLPTSHRYPQSIDQAPKIDMSPCSSCKQPTGSADGLDISNIESTFEKVKQRANDGCPTCPFLLQCIITYCSANSIVTEEINRIDRSWDACTEFSLHLLDDSEIFLNVFTEASKSLTSMLDNV